MKGDKIEQKDLIQKEIEDKTNNETFIKKNKNKSSIKIHEVFSNPFDNICHYYNIKIKRYNIRRLIKI